MPYDYHRHHYYEIYLIKLSNATKNSTQVHTEIINILATTII